MKRMMVLLILLSLLAGCAAPAEPTTEPVTESAAEAPAVEETTEAPTETEPAEYSLLENAQPLGEGLSLVDCPALEGTSYAEIFDFCGDLLLCWREAAGEKGETVRLCRIRITDGSAAAEGSLPPGRYGSPQIFGDWLAFCDSSSGTVCILDETLQITDTFHLTPGGEGDSWYMGSDTLYEIRDSRSIVAVDPETGEETELFRAAGHLYPMNRTDRGMFFTCADRETQLTETGFLNFCTGEVQLLEDGYRFGSLSLSGDTWTGTLRTDSGVSCFGRGKEDIRLCRDPEQSFCLPGDGKILGFFYSYLRLYDENGRFLSSCCPCPDELSYFTDTILPSEAYGGYFFLRFHETEDAQLLFWRPEPSQGKDLELKSPEEWEQDSSPSEEDSEIYERAEALSQKYGVQIHVGEDCPTEYMNFTCDRVTDPERISEGLDVLDRALSIYPENFLAQLNYGDFRTTHIYLMGALYSNGSLGEGVSYNGFAGTQADQNFIVVNLKTCNEAVYYHEISHILDKRLAWDHELRPEALYSEGGWNALNPEGFSYTESYIDYWKNGDSYADPLWFISDYSRISATEDRATLMQEAACGYEYLFQNGPGLLEKLRYYSRCIRDALDTTGWPEETPWEATLHRAENQENAA